MMAAFGLGVVLAVSIGTIHGGHDRVVAECSDCGAEQAAVQEKVDKLRTSSHWIARRKAARSLRGYDWRRHPEAVEALADAVRCDRQCLVRQEAAESLGKMKPCLPVAHETLARAAEADPSLIARCAAKKALKAVGKSCVEPCDVCEGDVEFGDEIPPLLDEPGFSPLPALPEGSSVVPETSLEPLAPTSFSTPIPPLTPSPVVPADDAGFPARPPIGPSRFDPRGYRRLAPPTVPIDRYNPRPGEAAPAPVGDDVSAPKVGWSDKPIVQPTAR